MLDYKMITYKIETADGMYWVAEFPKLKGVLGTSKDMQKAVSDLVINAQSHIEMMRELGLDIPKEDAKESENVFSGRITYRPGAKLHQEIYDLSKKEGLSINSYINNALSYYNGGKKALHGMSLLFEKFEKLEKTVHYQIVETQRKEKYIYGEREASMWSSQRAVGNQYMNMNSLQLDPN